MSRHHKRGPRPGGAVPGQVQAKLQLGMALHQQGRLAEAERAYRELLQKEPAHFDALHLLGVIAFQTGQTEHSVRLITKAIGLDPSLAAAHFHLGCALAALKRFEEALASYDRAIALKPDYAKAYGNRGVALSTLKRFEEALASLDQAIALRPDYAEALNNRGNALRELKRFEEALASYDRAVALKLDYAEAYGNRGNALKDLKRFEEALASYDQAIALKPDYAEAVSNRGNALRDLDRFEEALASYDQAIALMTDYAEAYCNRGNVLEDLGQTEEALASFDTAIALKPDYAMAHGNRAFVLKNSKRFAEALAGFDKAIALQPDLARAHFNQSTCLLLLGEFARGWRHYEWRKKLDVPVDHEDYAQPVWLGSEDVAGKTMLIHCRQGLGDTIQFCRYARLVQALGAKVILSVQDPLLGLLRQMEPDIETIGRDRHPAMFDYHCSLLSLPLAFGTTIETIPSSPRYLQADGRLRAIWAERVQRKTKPRIGIVWSGSVFHSRDRERSLGLKDFLPLFSDDAEWISLQKEIRAQDAVTLRDFGRIAFFGDELRDFSDTAALLDLMDLVITVDTSVAHLAGAMGKPVWILLPFCPDWRWLLDRSDSPWYPSARLFRQRERGDWATVVEEVKKELGTVIATGV